MQQPSLSDAGASASPERDTPLRISRIPPLSTHTSVLSSALTTRPSTAPYLLDRSPPATSARTLQPEVLSFSATTGALPAALLRRPSLEGVSPSPRRIPPLSPEQHHAIAGSVATLGVRRLAPLSSSSFSSTGSVSAIPAIEAPASPLAASRSQPHPYSTSGLIVSPIAPPPQYPLPSSLLRPVEPATGAPAGAAVTSPPAVVLPDIASLLVSCGLPAYVPSFYHAGFTDVAALLASPPERWQAMLDAVMADMHVRLARQEIGPADLQPAHRAIILQTLQREKLYYASTLTASPAPAPTSLPSTASPDPLKTSAPYSAAHAGAGAVAGPSHTQFAHFCHICRHWLCCFSIGAALLVLSGVFFAVYRALNDGTSSASTTSGGTSALTGFEALCGVGFAVGGLCLLVAGTCWLRWPEHRRCGGHGGCGGCGPADGVTCCAHFECEACVRCEEEWDDRDCCRGPAGPTKCPQCPACPHCPTFSLPACCAPSTKPSACPSCAHLTLPVCCERDPTAPSCWSHVSSFFLSCCAALTMCATSCCAAFSACCATIKWPQCGCGLTECIKECCEGACEHCKLDCCDDVHCCSGPSGGCAMPNCDAGCAECAQCITGSTCYKLVCCKFKIEIH